MGKKGGSSSWLTAVKRAFRSPTKDSQKKSSRRREENDHEPDEEEKVNSSSLHEHFEFINDYRKKREKRRWLFRKPSNNNEVQNEANSTVCHSELLPPDQRHAIAVAAATAAAAEAAAATAQAAVEIIPLTRSSNPSPTCLKHNCSAIIIQTAFRGYLARRALVALRGIVKLQALIRGQNVRKQAKMTLRCMQALLRLQTRMHECHQATRRLSQDGSLGIGGGSRKSMFAHSNNCFSDHPNCLGDILQDSKSMSKDRRSSNMSTDWSECPSTLEELEAALQARNEAIAFKRETALAHAFSQKMWNPDTQGMNTGERSNWLDQWMATKQWNDTLSNKGRVSTDKRDSSSFIKTVEMDMLPKQYSASANVRKFQHPSASPGHYRSTASMVNPPPPTTPSPPPSKPKQACPHHNKDDKSSYSVANTPSLRFNSSSIITRSGNAANYHVSNNNANESSGMPNYMAATESAKARLRSQSVPRQRPPTPERERGGLLSSSSSSSAAKKRLSFPAVRPEAATSNNCMSFNEHLRSPSFKSLQAGGCYLGLDQQSNQSCYTDSIAADISPSSTTDLRRWLR